MLAELRLNRYHVPAIRTKIDRRTGNGDILERKAVENGTIAMSELQITHTFVRKLTKNLRAEFGKDIPHTKVMETIAAALGRDLGPLMHELKNTSAISSKPWPTTAPWTSEGVKRIPSYFELITNTNQTKYETILRAARNPHSQTRITMIAGLPNSGKSFTGISLIKSIFDQAQADGEDIDIPIRFYAPSESTKSQIIDTGPAIRQIAMKCFADIPESEFCDYIEALIGKSHKQPIIFIDQPIEAPSDYLKLVRLSLRMRVIAVTDDDCNTTFANRLKRNISDWTDQFLKENGRWKPFPDGIFGTMYHLCRPHGIVGIDCSNALLPGNRIVYNLKHYYPGGPLYKLEDHIAYMQKALELLDNFRKEKPEFQNGFEGQKLSAKY